jgi:hypothetical protein
MGALAVSMKPLAPREQQTKFATSLVGVATGTVNTTRVVLLDFHNWWGEQGLDNVQKEDLLF